MMKLTRFLFLLAPTMVLILSLLFDFTFFKGTPVGGLFVTPQKKSLPVLFVGKDGTAYAVAYNWTTALMRYEWAVIIDGSDCSLRLQTPGDPVVLFGGFAQWPVR